MPENRDNFLDSFLGRTGETFRPSPMSKSVVKHDRWDTESANRLLAEFKEFSVAQDKLTDMVDTGGNFFNDAFYALVKANPELARPRDVRPTYQINRAVMDETMDLNEYEQLRSYTAGDEIGAALGCISMEPTFEQLFDKKNEQMKAAQEAAEKLEGMMMQMSGLAGEGEDLDAQIEAMMEAMQNGTAPGDAEQQMQNMQDQKALIDAAMEKLQEEGELVEQEFNDAMTAAQNQIKQAAKQAMNAALKDAQQNELSANAWGLDPGVLHRLPADQRIAMAKRMNNEKLRKIAELFGPMQRMAFAEQMRKTIHSKDEVYDVETGNDLARLLPMELMAIRHPLLKLDFYRRFYEENLLQYKLRGTEKLAKGGIICCIDGSGSMGGDREIWAKAVALCLLQIAKKQNRSFYGIHFGGPRQLKSYDFRDTKDITPDKVIEFAECFFAGGPLRVDQRVVTPDGWKAIGSLSTGDKVIGSDGKPTDVLGVFPQGVLDLYTITFSDGTQVVCDSTHRWTVSNPAGNVMTLTVAELLRRGISRNYDGKYGQASQKQYKYRIPTIQPVQFPEADLSVDPYLMGYLLGDGSFHSGANPRITAEGNDLPWVDVLPEGCAITNYEKRDGFCPNYGIRGPQRRPNCNPLAEGLKALELWGLSDEDKFIPDVYLWGSVEQRWALLQGLCDSDGSNARPGRVEFSNISRKLVDGVVQLVQSLGGGAIVKERKVRSNERPCYRVSIMLNQTDAPFRIARKVEGWKPRKYPWVRAITSITPSLSFEAVCIKVANDDGLFATEGFALTHNTDFATPLSKSLDILKEEYTAFSETRGDIVFITDGMCGVSEQWLAAFKEEQAKLGFRVFGIIIDAPVNSEPLKTISDNRMIQIKDLLSGGDIRDVFRDV